MKNIVLNNGIEMPSVGFGVFQITDYDQCVNAVIDALDVGYRLIDTAQSYGNEKAVGDAIAKSGIPREDLFITTKVWISNSGYEKAKESILKSLELMSLDYLDLVLIHQPIGDYYGTYRAMSDCQKEGLIKAIGVSNFYPDRLVDLSLNQEIIPSVNQIEVNPFHQQIAALPFNNKYNVQVQAWAPFAEGQHDIFNNQVLKKIGSKYDKTVAQVILRWLHQRNIVPLSKTINKERMKENINIFDFELSDSDMELIQSLDTETSSFFNHQTPEAVERLVSLVRNV